MKPLNYTEIFDGQVWLIERVSYDDKTDRWDGDYSCSDAEIVAVIQTDADLMGVTVRTASHPGGIVVQRV